MERGKEGEREGVQGGEGGCGVLGRVWWHTEKMTVGFSKGGEEERRTLVWR